MKKVGAYITAYEDINALLSCVNGITKQSYPIDKILIIDNSNNSITPLLIEKLTLDSEKIISSHYPENIGISGGLRIAIQWAIQQGYDFLWTFDQDSEPQTDTLKILISKFEELNSDKYPVGIIAPLSIDIKSNQEIEGALFGGYRFLPIQFFHVYQMRHFCNRKYYECDAVITSGSLISIIAARDSQLPNPDLFIDGVDWDYCLKVKAAGYHIIVVPEALLIHNFGNFLTNFKQSDDRATPIYSYSPLRYYYISRNHTYIETRQAIKRDKAIWSIAYRLKSLIKYVFIILFLDKDKFALKIWAVIKGTLDGFTGNLSGQWSEGR